MHVRKDGGVTLTKREWTELGEAYGNLHTLLVDMPSFLGDYFDYRKDYINVCKWSEQLAGREFDPKDFESGDEEDDEE